MKYLIANWKSNFTTQEAEHWIKKVKKNQPRIHPQLQIIVCPSFIHLPLLSKTFPHQVLGAQTLSAFPDGTYTGAVSARMLNDVVDYAIIGHSERRHYFHETDQTVANQVTQALENNLTPIVSVSQKNWRSQLTHFSASQLSKIIIMYEPPEAISNTAGQGEAAPVDTVTTEIKKITADFTPKAMLYGGSVKTHNLTDFLSQSEIDGVVVGSASLDPNTWLEIVSQANMFCLTATENHS